MEPQQAQALRAAFPPELVGKLPKGGTQLDYVGHAAVTDRLLAVDPLWSWEPLAFDPDGGPLVRNEGTDSVLWIRMTVCGVTRIGVGIAATKSFELSKQLVSDAIRNAAMRFGVALDLWSKEDLHATTPEPTIPPSEVEGFRGFLNDRDKDTRAEWLRIFGVKPADLPLSQLNAANAWCAKIVAAE